MMILCVRRTAAQNIIDRNTDKKCSLANIVIVRFFSPVSAAQCVVEEITSTRTRDINLSEARWQ